MGEAYAISGKSLVTGFKISTSYFSNAFSHWKSGRFNFMARAQY